MTRTISIAALALLGGWFSGGLVYSAGMGGLFWFLIGAAAWSCLVAILASRFIPLLAALPGIAMSVRISVINHVDPRLYNDLVENIRWGIVFSTIAVVISLLVSVPIVIARRANQLPQNPPATR